MSMHRSKTQIRTAVISVFALSVVFLTSGCTRSTPDPDPGCTADYPTARPVTYSNIPAEETYLENTTMCAGTATDGSTIYSLTNNTDAVWIFSAGPNVTNISTDGSAAFRDTVTRGSLYQHAYMAPGDVIQVGVTSRWTVNPNLTYVWAGEQVYQSVLTRVATKAATKLFGAGSDSREAVISCGISFANSATHQNLTSSSKEQTILTVFGDVGTAGTCADAVAKAVPELGAKNTPEVLTAVHDAGAVADQVGKFHFALSLVKTFCAAAHC